MRPAGAPALTAPTADRSLTGPLRIGYLILRSTFLPRILGVLMAVGGLGWWTFLTSALSLQLSPYNMAPGIPGETALAVWLLAVGVNARAWNEQASAAA